MSRHRVGKALGRLVEATRKLPPKFPANEIGLMTQDEFLKHRNPGRKYHPSTSYDFSLADLNRDYSRRVLQRIRLSRGGSLTIEKASRGHLFVYDDEVVAVLHNGTLYRTNRLPAYEIPKAYWENQKRVELPIRRRKLVKYLDEYVSLVSNISRRNIREHPHTVQNVIVDGEPFFIRSEKRLKKDAGTNLSMMNSRGEVVAVAQNEWGATLIVVAKEYRRRGLGRVIGKYWYRWNPRFK